MFQINPLVDQTKPKASFNNLADRLLGKRNGRQTAHERELPKTKCAGGVCMVDWRPIPLFYTNRQSC